MPRYTTTSGGSSSGKPEDANPYYIREFSFEPEILLDRRSGNVYLGGGGDGGSLARSPPKCPSSASLSSLSPFAHRYIPTSLPSETKSPPPGTSFTLHYPPPLASSSGGSSTSVASSSITAAGRTLQSDHNHQHYRSSVRKPRNLLSAIKGRKRRVRIRTDNDADNDDDDDDDDDPDRRDKDVNSDLRNELEAFYYVSPRARPSVPRQQ